MTIKLHLQQGLSLVELLISALIMGFVTSAILISYINNVRLNESSRNLTKATVHAEHVLESIRNAAINGFNNLSSNINYNNFWNCGSNNNVNWSCTSSPNYSTFQVLLPSNGESITTTASGTNPLTIQVQVNWSDVQQRARTISLQTLIGN